MTASRRWCAVAVATLALLALPFAGRLVPVADSDVSAAALLAQVNDSEGVAYSGFVESAGALRLPVTDDFSGLAELLGEQSRLRVWWRGGQDWRVDAIEPTGETDLIHSPAGTTIWEYESMQVTATVDPVIRLPRTADLLPPTLARLLLRGADVSEVDRIDADRIAGRDAAGLRFRPSDNRSSVRHVDVWVDAASGLPVRVSLFGPGRVAAITTSFLSLSTEMPDAASTAFDPPPGADVRFDDVVDIAAAADRFAPVEPPNRLAGLERRARDGLGAVGQYGQGVTSIVAIPLRDETACALRDQMTATRGARTTPVGTRVVVGPLALLLTPEGGDEDSAWLVGGTVTRQTLTTAARELAGSVRR